MKCLSSNKVQWAGSYKSRRLSSGTWESIDNRRKPSPASLIKNTTQRSIKRKSMEQASFKNIQPIGLEKAKEISENDNDSNIHCQQNAKSNEKHNMETQTLENKVIIRTSRLFFTQLCINHNEVKINNERFDKLNRISGNRASNFKRKLKIQLKSSKEIELGSKSRSSQSLPNKWKDRSFLRKPKLIKNLEEIERKTYKIDNEKIRSQEASRLEIENENKRSRKGIITSKSIMNEKSAAILDFVTNRIADNKDYNNNNNNYYLDQKLIPSENRDLYYKIYETLKNGKLTDSKKNPQLKIFGKRSNSLGNKKKLRIPNETLRNYFLQIRKK